jgi:hypothetical protein
MRHTLQSVCAAAALALLAGAASGPALLAQATTDSRVRTHVATLASDRFDGRQAGTAGERLAGDYIQGELTRNGVLPLPGQDGLFLPFEFTAGSRDGGSTLTVMQRAENAATSGGGSGTVYQGESTVQALSFSDDAEVSGEVVFAGYGLVVPETQGVSYDSYAALDVTDKVVVVLRYFPEDAEPSLRAVLARYSDLRYKAMAARQRGARALVVVTGPRSPNAGQTVPMTFDTAIAGSGIPALSVGGAAAAAIFDGAPRQLADVQADLDSGNPHVAGFALPGALAVAARVIREKQTARNVVGYLPATMPTADVERPWILIGAHYDHLGHGTQGTSLAGKDEAGGIHHGADDNASGTAAVLALADVLAQQPRRRNIILALWSAEEVGLVGSNAYATAPPVPIDQLAAALNFDMVGRMQENKLVAQATGTSVVWGRILERANVAAGFDLVVQPDPYQPTDIATFNQAGVPSLSFTTGSHVDYHKPSDTADKIDYEDLDRIVDFAAAIVRATGELDPAPAFVKVDQPTSRVTSMAGVRVTTGTIPDYTSDVSGLLLGGVIGGGPAEQAGLAKGDVIVEIAGQTIANIYDYTYALELLKVNESVKVVYLRDGKRAETQLTPAARR